MMVLRTCTYGPIRLHDVNQPTYVRHSGNRRERLLSFIVNFLTVPTTGSENTGVAMVYTLLVIQYVIVPSWVTNYHSLSRKIEMLGKTLLMQVLL